MKRKLAEFKGTIWGYDLYWKINTHGNERLENVLDEKFEKLLKGTEKKESLWTRIISKLR